MKRFFFIGVFGVAVAALALALNFFSSREPLREKNLASVRPVAPAAPNRVARDSGIPIPAPPPVAAYAPGQPAPKAEPKSVSRPAKPSARGVTAGVAAAVEEKIARARRSPAAPAVTATPTVDVSPPTFDVVRVNPAGDAVIAGRAAPGATVAIYDGDRLTGTVVADDRGDWVYLPSKPLPSGKRELSLSARTAEGVETRSRSVVVLVVPDRTQPTGNVGLAQTAEPAKSARSAKPAESAKSSEPVKKPKALAVLVSRDGSTPSRVLQNPVEPGGVGGKNLSIGVVEYDEKGNVNIGGKGKPGAGVQVYVDNRLIGRSKVGPKGNWNVGPEEKVKPGIYKLRVDATRKGKVVSRVEIPFSRADPATAKQNESLVVVQPGNSLWRIARRTLGKGIRYVEIYSANQSKIVDPDLIYPGQVFSLPSTN